jgi:hypothetical protein
MGQASQEGKDADDIRREALVAEALQITSEKRWSMKPFETIAQLLYINCVCMASS